MALGAGATRFKLGDDVCALVNGGGYADFAVAPEATTLPAPQGLSTSKPPRCPKPCSPSGIMCSSARAEARRMAARAWRRERHRHHRNPDRHGFGAHVIVTVGSAEKARAC